MDIQKHSLVPKHEIVAGSEEINNILNELDIASKEYLPKILVDDAVVNNLGAEPGDVLRITRNSTTRDSSEKTIETAITYRVVIN